MPFMDAFGKQLRKRVRGRVILDPLGRGIYSSDAGIYQIQPVAVVVPDDQEDVIAAVETAAAHGVGIIPRGAGTSLGGQVTGRFLVVDFSKNLNRVLEWDPREKRARVQPGVIRDDLNRLVASQGLHFAPDPATSDRATVGGMIGNNSSGMRSIVHGRTSEHLIAAKVLLADGSLVTLEELPPEEYERRSLGDTREAEILRGLKQVVHDHREEIGKRFPKVMRRVGGYALDHFVSTDRWNPAMLLAGSEGTLAIVLEAELRLTPLPRHTALCIPHFRSLDDALRAVPGILPFRPSAVEVLDNTVITGAQSNSNTAALCDFLEGNPGSILIVEFSGEDAGETAVRAQEFAEAILDDGVSTVCPIRLESDSQSRVWSVRKSGLGLVTSLPGARRGIPFIEDACVPVEHLADYIERIDRVCRKHGTRSILYGHASVGVLHVRPALDLHKTADVEIMKAISREAFDLVCEYGGSWSGEHGDGLARSAYLEKFFGREVYAAFRDVKRLFDPDHLLNPGKIIDGPPIEHNLRYRPGHPPPIPKTEYHFRSNGGILSAIERCVGIGACRETNSGTMCPSYAVTRNEEDSTRGRANALRLAIAGELGPDAIESDAMRDVLDICLSCKSCKSECPNNVDIARFKSEFLQRYHDRHGTSFRERLIAASPGIASIIAGRAAPLVNAIAGSSPFRLFQEITFGFSRRRKPPAYTDRPLPDWFTGHRAEKRERKVVLFDDTYMNYHEPHVGRAAVGLLESCGYEVIPARAGCCQRPRISHGFLRDAKREGEKTLRNLDHFIRRGLPVVVCEPGCASALTDDLPDLIDDAELGERIVNGVYPIEVFLDREIREGRLEARFVSTAERIAVHGHCHQKALTGMEPLRNILSTLPGVRIEELDTGCCGMAGSFGYEKEHYEISMRIGEERLFPTLRSLPPGTAVIACGFSCRHQIADATGIRAHHWVETVRPSHK